MKLSVLLLILCCAGSLRGSDDPTIVYLDADSPFMPEPASAEREAANEELRFAISPERRKKTGARLEAGKISGEMMTVSFLNDSDETVHINGFGFLSPHRTPEILLDGSWKHAGNHMNCGTGAFLSPLPPGYGFHFLVRVPPGSEPFRLKVQAMSPVDEKGRRKITEIQMPPVDPVKKLVRDSESIVDVTVHEEELVNVMWEKEEDPFGGDQEDKIKDSMLVKRAAVTAKYKGPLKPGETVEYLEVLKTRIKSIEELTPRVKRNTVTLFISKDAGSWKNRVYAMETEGYRSVDHMKGVMPDVFRNELQDNPKLEGQHHQQGEGKAVEQK